jgi:hypothetical protein
VIGLSRVQRLRPPAGIPALFAAAYVGSALAFAPDWTVDDAFVVQRYAERWVAGLGLTFREGPPTGGVTAPLWLALVAVARGLGLPGLATSKVVGVLAVALAVHAVVADLRRRIGGRSAALFAGFLLVPQAPLALAGTAGLSTGLATLAATRAGLAATRRPDPRFLELGLAVGALAWMRPELAPAMGALLILGSLRRPRPAWRAWALALAGSLGVLLYREAVFGHPLPLALSAKPAELANGLPYLAGGLVLITGGGGILLAALGARLGRGEDLGIGAALVAHAVAVVLAGGDWMPGLRLLAPMLPLYAHLSGTGAFRACLVLRRRKGDAGSADPREDRRRRPGPGPSTAALVLVAGLALGLPPLAWWAARPDARAGAVARRRDGDAVAAALAGTSGGPVALVDVGWLVHRAGLDDVVDLGGITDPEIARLAGGHLDKRLPEALLRRRAPTVIVLHSQSPPVFDEEGRLLHFRGHPVEHRVAAMPWVRRRFRVASVHPYGDARFYVVLRRR